MAKAASANANVKANASSAKRANSNGAKPVDAKSANAKAANSNSAKQANSGAKRDTRRVKHEPNQCRLDLYNQFRKDCRTAISNKEKCAVVEGCQQFGVESEHWPVDMWPLPKEAYDVIGSQNIRDGRNCMTRIMWSDPKMGEALRKCGGPEPASLNPNAAKAAAPKQAATPKPQASKASGSNSQSAKAAPQVSVEPKKKKGLFDLSMITHRSKSKSTPKPKPKKH